MDTTSKLVVSLRAAPIRPPPACRNVSSVSTHTLRLLLAPPPLHTTSHINNRRHCDAVCFTLRHTIEHQPPLLLHLCFSTSFIARSPHPWPFSIVIIRAIPHGANQRDRLPVGLFIHREPGDDACSSSSHFILEKLGGNSCWRLEFSSRSLTRGWPVPSAGARDVFLSPSLFSCPHMIIPSPVAF